MSDTELPIKEAAVPHRAGTMMGVGSLSQLIDVSGRSCRLFNSRNATGSAFLIGPDLVMTAYHVIKAIWSSLREGDEIYIEFYGSTEGPVKRDRIGITEGDVIAFSPDDELDYAIIRLPDEYGLHRYEEASSRMRGWFPLSTARQRLTEMEKPMALLHFPVVRDDNVVFRDPVAGKTLYVVSEGTLTRKVNDRFYHSAATEEGSSGGLCFINRSLTPFALHVATHGNENIAVEMATIIADIERRFPEVGAELFSTPLDKLCPRTSRDDRPILNRDQLILKLLNMMLGVDTRPLYAFGSQQSGRTFINKIVEAFRPSKLHERIEISTLGQSPKIIREIAWRMFGTTRGFEPYENVETFASYFRRGVGNLLHQIDQEAATRHVISFVFFDGFDVVDEDSRDLFMHICGLATELKNVRIALSGSIDPPVGAVVEQFELGPIKPGDFEKLAERYCIYYQLGLSPALREEAVRIVLDSVDFTQATLVMHANRAHDLCYSLRELALV
ncbi:serine protease [Rhizobium sp. FKY42]|uniref:trypsin-like serine peptidase n=1 Tax=Rhizobium sp. FKY42 TaxID=2562310 RepID=UPI0010C0EEC4|nr:serine protease [Rhizobium sp. FKY42]